ncbi:MAG: hypothetical protein HPY66_1886 [Firmicutes bacterium]|nr:hypothetical protein [Bacillota bacterium]
MLQSNEILLKVSNSPAGVGKSFLFLNYALQQVEHGKFGKLIFIKPDVSIDGKKYPAIPGGINENPRLCWVF